MSEQGKKAAEGLNVLLEKLSDSGRERLLDFGNGYIRGFRDGSAVQEKLSDSGRERLFDFGNGYIWGFRDSSAVQDAEPEAMEASEEAAT